MLRPAIYALMVFLSVSLACASDTAGTGENSFQVLSLTLAAPIGPVQEEMLQEALEEAKRRGDNMLLIKLDTPGGLAKSMRGMIRQMLNSSVPVAVWVGPEGARATSAGVFVVAASTVAAMAPNTTIGSASPVSMGGKDIDETMAAKIKNEIMSLVRAVASSRGRNVQWYEQAVEHSVSITASEAVMQRVVEFVAKTPRDFLVQAAARGIALPDGGMMNVPEQVVITEYQPGFRYEFLTWLLNPSVAYLLMLGGMAGLFFEMTSPGAIFPGVFGGICLLLALYALAVLPTNIAGVLLILFGLLLFALEIKITSFGLLGVAGAVSLLVGSLILFRGAGQGFSVPLSMVASTVITLSVFLAVVVQLVIRARKQAYTMGEAAMIGLVGKVRKWQDDHGEIMVRGEIWSARSDAPMTLRPGDLVRVVRSSGLQLLVERESMS